MKEIMVLVGFGKIDLSDVLKMSETEVMDMLNNKQWPPRYRRISICTDEEVDNYSQFAKWAAMKVTRDDPR